MTGCCRHHSFERAASICHRCGVQYCTDCLIHPFGKSKPLCKNCAMTVSGVRTHAALPAMPKRKRRAAIKAFAKRAGGVVPEATPIEELIGVPELVAATAGPDPAAGVAPPIDWSRPFG